MVKRAVKQTVKKRLRLHFPHFKTDSPHSLNVILILYLPEFPPQIAYMDLQGAFHTIRSSIRDFVITWEGFCISSFNMANSVFVRRTDMPSAVT